MKRWYDRQNDKEESDEPRPLSDDEEKTALTNLDDEEKTALRSKLDE